MPETRTTRVLVVDDHSTFAELLSDALDREPDLTSVGHATTASAALGMLAEARPDLVMMDVALPDLDGFAATERLLLEAPGLHVIILTAYTDLAFVARAAQVGAKGFLPKDGSLEHMLRTIRAVTAGSLGFERPSDGEAWVAIGRDAVSGPGGLVPALTPREDDVLQLIAQGMGVRDAAETLGITEQTCRGYVKTLLVKLGAHTQLQAVVRAGQLGLLGPGRDRG